MAEDRKEPDAAAIYASLLRDLTDLITDHAETARGIAEAATTTLSSFIDPESKDKVEQIADKLTQRLNKLTQTMLATRNAIEARVKAAYTTKTEPGNSAVRQGTSSETPAPQSVAVTVDNPALTSAISELTSALAQYTRESAGAQQQAAASFADLALTVQREGVPSITDVVDKLDAALDALKANDSTLPTASRPSAVVANTNPHEPSSVVQPQPQPVDESPAPFSRSYKPSRAGEDLGDSTYDDIKHRDLETKRLGALQAIANAWRKVDTDGSIGNLLDYAALGAMLTGLLGGLLPNVMTRFPALGIAGDVLKYIREGKLLTAIESVLSKRWGQLVELADATRVRALAVAEWFKVRAMPILEYISESPLVKGVTGAADKLRSMGARAVTGVSEALSPVTSFVSRGVNAVRASPFVADVVSGARTAYGAVASTASSVVGRAGELGGAALSRVGSAVSHVGGSLWRGAQALAGTAVGSFIQRNLSRLGKFAMVLDVLLGVMEEATGKKVDEVDVIDAILNPMKMGRFLGNKGNQLFERTMGQSVGSWLYDMLGDDPVVAQLTPAYATAQRSPQSAPQTPYSPTAVQPGGTTPVQEQVPARSTVKEAPPRAQTTSAGAPYAPAVSAPPSLSPGSIPNYTGIDPATGALLFGALAR